MKRLMNRVAFAFVAFSTGVAYAQTAPSQPGADLVSKWLVKVEGESRTRTLSIKGIKQATADTFDLDALYGWTDGNQPAVKAEITQIAQERKLTLTTAADSKIVAVQAANGNFSGTITLKNGKSKAITFEKTVVLTQARAFLPKADVEAMANGKKWNHVRVADQQKIRWDLRNAGALYANNYNTNQRDEGTWLVNDKGELCVKWRGRSEDRCVAILKDGDKLKMVDSKDLNGVYAELTAE